MTFWPGYPPPVPPKPPWYRNLMVWLWVYVAFAVLAVGAFFGLFVFGDFEGYDGYEDDYYYVGQDSVNRAVVQPCSDMTKAGEDIKVFSTPAEGADALHRFVTAGRGIPAAIDTVDDPEGSARRWQSDWVTMLDALDAYADELAGDPGAQFTAPVDGDGGPLTYALAGVSDVPCELPAAVVALDPDVSFYPY